MKIYKVIALSIIILLLVIIPLKLNIKNDNKQNHLFFEKILDYTLPELTTETTQETEQVSSFNFYTHLLSGTLPFYDPNLSAEKDYTQNYMISTENINTETFHDGNPLVVIYHSHTTESYFMENDPSTYRNHDPDSNMIIIGSIMSKVLYEEYGIGVVHITDIFDNPYDGAYARSRDALYNCMEKYPGIKYSFDVHRDGLNYSEENMSVYQTLINDIPCAKVMIVLGVEAENTAANYEEANEISSLMENMYPGLFKRILERNYVYNQDMAEKSMLFEVGSNLSTLQEAKNSAVFLARAIGEAIKKDMGNGG